MRGVLLLLCCTAIALSWSGCNSGGADPVDAGSGGSGVGGSSGVGGGSGMGGGDGVGGGGVVGGGVGGGGVGGGGGGTGDGGGTGLGGGGGGSVIDSGAVDAGSDAGVDAGRPDAGPLVCPAGRADCDSNPADCETNIATDALNCGRCARACGGAAACTTGLCAATVVMDPDVASNYCGSAFTADQLFSITCWGNNLLSEVRWAPLQPGADVRGTSIVAYNNLPLGALRGILVDGDSVYFGIEGSPSNVFKYPIDHSGVVSIAFTSPNATRFNQLQLVGDTYYWADNSNTAAGAWAPSELKRRKKTDTADTTLYTGMGPSGQLVVTDTELLWLEERTAGAGFKLYEAPLDGGSLALATEVAPIIGGAYMIRAGNFVVWTEKVAAPNGKLRRYEFGNPAAVAQDLVVNLNLPEGLISDGQFLYFKQLDSLYRVDLGGLRPPERLSVVVPANDQQTTELMHVDAKYVYFPGGPTAGDSKIYRVAK